MLTNSQTLVHHSDMISVSRQPSNPNKPRFFPTRAVTIFSPSSEIYAGSFSSSDYSSSSSSMSPEEEEIYNKLRAADIFDHE
ncbi:hypothetical protein Bca4012_060657 [Brassica carinata]